MSITNLPRLLRSLAATPSRRGVVRTLAGIALAGVPGLTEAKNKKKRRKRKKNKKPNPPTCTELCGVGCTNCFFRADAPPLCGGDGGVIGLPCASDDDCVGGNEPYCVARIEIKETGETLDVCEEINCAADELGACAAMGACNP